MSPLLLLLACRTPEPSPSVDGETTLVDTSEDTSSTSSSTASTAATASTGDSAPAVETVSPALAFVGAPPRNVLMISIDTLRADHVNGLGDKDLTPRLARWFDEGVLATDVMQCSNWTYASTSCTLLGRDNVEHGFMPRLEGSLEMPYPDGEAFLATFFQDAGYRTAITSRNGFLSARTNNIQGYETELNPLRPAQTQMAGMLEHLKMTDDGRPFFVHVHTVEPHSPYDAPAEYEVGRDELDPVDIDFTDDAQVSDLRRTHDNLPPDELALVQAHARVVYEAEVRYLDAQLDLALENWREEGLLDDTLVVFWSDHGEQLWEHGQFTHAYDLFHGENDALFALWADNLVPLRWEGPVSMQDLAPTLLAVAGLDVPDEMTGHTLGEAPEDRLRRAMAVARGQGHNAMRRGDQKLVFRWTTGEHFLFDRGVDPEETDNVWDPTNPEHLALWDELLPYVQATEAMVSDVSVDWKGETP